MDEYKVELFIASDDEQDVVLSSLNEKEMEKWKKALEECALSEYYDQKVNIKVKI